MTVTEELAGKERVICRLQFFTFLSHELTLSQWSDWLPITGAKARKTLISDNGQSCFTGYLSLKSSYSLVSWTPHLDSRLFWYLGNQTFPKSLDVSSLSQNPNCSYPNLLSASHKHLAGLHSESLLQFRGATGANSRPGSQGLTIHHPSCSFSPHDRDAHADLKTQARRYRVSAN